jgi:Chromate resistance exported protein
MKWVTRERPKIDRLACPWLILWFIDRVAKIRYVPAAHVLTVVRREGAIPFDRTGATDSEQKVRKIRCTTLTGLDPLETIANDRSREDNWRCRAPLKFCPGEARPEGHGQPRCTLLAAIWS